MWQPISRRQHGLADYTYVPAVFAAPRLAGFAGDARPARLARAFSVAVLASALCTRAEWGAFKLVPFRAHLALDAASGVLAFAAPWALGFAGDRRARNTFLALGVIGVVAALLTRPEEMPRGRR